MANRKLPDTMERECQHCKKLFTATRRGVNWKSYCDTCSNNKVWLYDKRGK